MVTQEQAGGLCVVLVATRNSLNIGAAARAMSNFGILDLRVVRPWEPAFREARSAVGAASLLQAAAHHDTVSDAVADCQLVIGTSAGARRDTQHVIHRLDAAARLIQNQLTNGRVAILFGSEKFGLSNDDMSHCHWLMHIPTRDEHLSMNLGQAVAVCLYELVRQPLGTGEAAKLPAHQMDKPTAADRERLAAMFHEMLDLSGYLAKHPRGNMPAHLRRIVNRLSLNMSDAQAMQGMLRQILWKLALDQHPINARTTPPSAPPPSETSR